METEVCRNTAASTWSSHAALDSMDVLLDVDIGGGIDPGIFPAQRIRDERCHSPERTDYQRITDGDRHQAEATDWEESWS